MLGCDRIVFRPRGFQRVDAVVAWGRKETAARAREYAERHGVPYVIVEDGFLRSMGLGVSGVPPLSIVLDDLGIYYDAGSPSRLESILQGNGGEKDPLSSPLLLDRASQCIADIRRHRLSKYNDSPFVELESRERPRVLVVDQTEGDLSVKLGLPVDGGFARMLEAAIDENPDADILLKTHPDVASGHKEGYLARVAAHDRVSLLSDPMNPIGLLEQVDKVYAMTSLMGFEALLSGKAVSCFGVPFYAGWGLTDDRVSTPRRKRQRSLSELFAAAYLLYARYVDPESGRRCEAERVIEYLALQRSVCEKNRGTVHCVDFTTWKKGFVPAFLQCPGNRVLFPQNAKALEHAGVTKGSKILVWGSRESSKIESIAKKHGTEIWRMEDGFLRSVGLGSDLVTPVSLVVDRLGIYFDPTRPSELEQILEEGEFTPEELGRAAALRKSIVEHGVSKYNVGGETGVGLGRKTDQTVVLVVGQVEDDASIELGGPGIRRNADLLRAARGACPDAYLIFKPHPDVVSGNRAGAVSLAEAQGWADEVVERGSLAHCLAAADEVHTMTSLVGFEALLRGLRVIVYGQPFYGGWGLTEDRHPHPRRTRRLELDELVTGTLIRYPRYVNWQTGAFTTPERVVDELRQGLAARGGVVPVGVGWARHHLRRAKNYLSGMKHAP